MREVLPSDADARFLPGGDVPRRLEIRLLNGLEVLRATRPIDLPRSRKTRALFAYLVTPGAPERRERLCDLFFDGPNDPRAALRWSLAKLRPLVDEPDHERLIADRDVVRFDARDVSVDVGGFRMRISAGLETTPVDELREMATALRGEPYAGLDLDGGYEYSAWLASQRDAIRRWRVTTLRALTDRLSDSPEASLPYARELVAVDPLDDDAHARLIATLNALGRSREAGETFDECRRVMRRELGREPSIVVGRARARRAAVSAASAASPRATPFVGRSSELSTMRSIADSGGVVLVTGEPGIGKTRLVEELGAVCAAAGGTVLHGRAFEAEMIRPYGPWIGALRPSLDSLEGKTGSARHLQMLIPGSASPSDARARPFDRTQLFDAVVEILATMARDASPVAVTLDDLHWFDDASVALLHHVVRARIPGAVVALTARPPELAARGPAAALVRGLKRDGVLTQITLGPLAYDEVVSLVRHVHADVDGAHVASASDGNPLFALEIARGLAAGDAGIPQSLEATIDDHLARLGPRARELVTWAAALGASFTPRMLACAADVDDATLFAALGELEQAGIIRQASGGAGYDFSHDLIRRVAYDRLSEPRARETHLAIARRLTRLDDPMSMLAGDVAAHALRGGDARLAATACARAADRSLRVFALVEARQLARQGIAALESADASAAMPARERVAIAVSLYETLVHAGGAVGRESELLDALERLAEEARVAGLTAAMQTLLYLVSYIHFHGGDWARAAVDTLRAVEAGRAADDETAIRSLANSGRCLASIERHLAHAAELLAEARERAARVSLSVIDIPWGDGILAQWRGDTDAAVQLLGQAVSAARVREEHWPVCDCLARLASLELERGNYAAARAHCADLMPVAARLGDASERPFAEAIDALAVLMSGAASEEAEAKLRGAIQALEVADAKGARSQVLVAAADWLWSAGRRDEAVANAEAAVRAADAVGRRTESAMACLFLARAALAQDPSADVRPFVDPVLRDAATADGLAARALRRLAELQRELAPARTLSSEIPTVVPTPVATPTT